MLECLRQKQTLKNLIALYTCSNQKVIMFFLSAEGLFSHFTCEPDVTVTVRPST